MLGRFRRELDFEEHGKQLAQSGGGALKPGGGLCGVEGIDGVKQLRGLAGFVVLQWADEMHFKVVERSERGGFGLDFLDAIFSEEPLPGVVGLGDGVGRMHFAHGHEANGVGRPAGTATGSGEFILRAPELVADGHVLSVRARRRKASRHGLHLQERFPRLNEGMRTVRDILRLAGFHRLIVTPYLGVY